MNEQVRNLKNLLAVGERLLARRDGNIGFGVWDCGTFACLLGHYGREHKIDKDVYTHIPWGYEHFGLRDGSTSFNVFHDDWNKLFGVGFLPGQDSSIPGNEPGDEAYAELGRRLAYLRQLIAELDPQPKPAPRSAIPDSVRAIFETAQSAPVC